MLLMISNTTKNLLRNLFVAICWGLNCRLTRLYAPERKFRAENGGLEIARHTYPMARILERGVGPNLICGVNMADLRCGVSFVTSNDAFYSTA